MFSDPVEMAARRVVLFLHPQLCSFFLIWEAAAWSAIVLVYTYIVHIIAKFGEQSCTGTLFMHGFSSICPL